MTEGPPGAISQRANLRSVSKIKSNQPILGCVRKPAPGNICILIIINSYCFSVKGIDGIGQAGGLERLYYTVKN